MTRPRHRKEPDRSIVRVLAASAIFLGVFDVLIWRNVLTEDALTQVVAESTAAVSIKAADAAPLPVVPESIGVPVRIRIPGIAVDAPVERVDLTADGSMDVPKRPFDTGWLELGPHPGETGSAVIAGHVDWVDGTPAVFADLHKIRPGDTIEVQDDAGTIIAFVVREIRKYDAEANATDVFSSNDGKAHLNLITCYGEWDKSNGQYSERLVVFADKVAGQ